MQYVFDQTKKYALAVSGGIDSMVMLHSIANLVPRPDFFVVTVNHGIRANAQRDCDFVAKYCKLLNVECQTYCVDVPYYAKQNGLSEETAARILRYRVFDGLDCDFVCLAHHADDNVETVLMHLLRGSGANGVVGIKQVNGKYVRPMLDLFRKDIVSYAQKFGVPHVDDSTNRKTKYTRNYVRHKLVPSLQKVNANAKQNILRFAENISADDDYLNSLADISTVIWEDNSARIPKSLLTQPTPVAYRILHKVFVRLGVYYDVEKSHLQSLCNLANNVGGKSISLPFGYVATNDYDFVTVEQSQSVSGIQFECPFAVGSTSTPFGTVTVSQNAGGLMFDLAKIPQSAVIRTRKQGDEFTKFGGGTKSLKKYLIDKKIPQRQRDNLLLVADGNKVLVILGVEISNAVRVDGNVTPHYITITKE